MASVRHPTSMGGKMGHWNRRPKKLDLKVSFGTPRRLRSERILIVLEDTNRLPATRRPQAGSRGLVLIVEMCNDAEKRR